MTVEQIRQQIEATERQLIADRRQLEALRKQLWTILNHSDYPAEPMAENVLLDW